MAEGHFSRRVAVWEKDLLRISALVEAQLDFSDEDDVPEGAVEKVASLLGALLAEIIAEQERPSAQRLRDVLRVVLAGPPKAGKYTLLNALAGRNVALVSPTAGTTRALLARRSDATGKRILEEEAPGFTRINYQ